MVKPVCMMNDVISVYGGPVSDLAAKCKLTVALFLWWTLPLLTVNV